MPFVARQAPQANNQSSVQPSTTTVYTQPTVTNAPPQNSGVTVPVAAIVGGVIGGMVLAIIITAGWICWGKSIKRSAAKERNEAEAFHKTRSNTMRNATVSKPRVQAYRPLFARPAEKKIRFAGEDRGNADDGEKEDEKVDSRQQEVTLPSLDAPRTTPSAMAPGTSKQRPLRPIKGTQRLSSLATASKDRLSLASLRDSGFFTPKVAHKPSTISSGSLYSTASGEERDTWGRPHSILAALNLEGLGGNSNTAHRAPSGGADHQSPSSSKNTFFSALSVFDQGSNRHSQASNSSVYDRNGPTIGIAI